MSLEPIFAVLFWVGAWFSMEGFRILKVGPLKNKKKKYLIRYDFTSLWNLIYGTNEPFDRKETHGLGEQTCSCQRWGVGGTGSLGLIDANYCVWSE